MTPACISFTRDATLCYMISVDPRWEKEVRRLACESRLAGYVEGMCVGMEVQTTGRGNTRRWRGYRGRIERIEGRRLHVSFDNLPEQTLDPDEIRPVTRTLCWCARCTWEREHHQ